MLAIVDSGPLYAVTDIDDEDHLACLAVFERPDLRLVIPALVVAEVTCMVGRRLGAQAEARFLHGLASFDIEAPVPEDWPRMAELVRQYADFPLGSTDASAVALAERLQAKHIVTLDHRHFGAVRPRHCAAFTLLP